MKLFRPIKPYQAPSALSLRDFWRAIRRTNQLTVIIVLVAIMVISGVIALSHRGPARGGFSLTSSAITGGKLPTEFTCDGSDINPPFEIKSAPDKTQSLAIWAENLDASKEESKLPNNNLWLVFNIPTTTTQVIAGIRPPGTITRDYKGNFNYNGPCPETGKKARVVFHLEALDIALLPVNSTASLAEFKKAIKGHVIAEAELSATFAREK